MKLGEREITIKEAEEMIDKYGYSGEILYNWQEYTAWLHLEAWRDEYVTDITWDIKDSEFKWLLA